MRLWTGFVLGAIGLVAVGWGVDSVAGDSSAVRGDVGAAAGFVGAVLVVRGDEVLLARGYGAADPVSGRPVEPDTLFDIGSVTKSITALAVLCLAADGKLSLDDPIGKHLTGVPSPRRGITVRQLLGHTSGLGGVYPAAKADRKSFVSGFLALATAGAPGEGFAYSNPGYTLLAAIVEEVSGRGFEEYVRERIFSRAGMADSGFIQGAGVE